MTRYNAFGEQREVVDAAGALTHYQHDGLGRVTHVTRPHGTDTFTWGTQAPALGRLVSALSADGVATSYQYDEFGRRTQETVAVAGSSLTLDYGYDEYGRLRSVKYPELSGESRLEALYDYTEYGELRSVHGNPRGSTPAVLYTVKQRAPSGQLSRVELGNGIAQQYRYDRVGALRFLESAQGTAAVQRLAYAYDAGGNLTGRFDLLAKTREGFGYDVAGRLTSWSIDQGCGRSRFEYTYGPDGNLTGRMAREGGGVSEVYGYGEAGAGPHALTSGPAGTYVYDARGYQVQGPDRGVDYLVSGLPRRVTRGTDVVEFSYSAANTRARKLRSNGDETLYAGSGLYERRKTGGVTRHLFSFTVDGTPVAQAVWEAGSGGVLSRQVYYLHRDAVASVVTVTDAAGAVVERLRYDPFGRRVSPGSLAGVAVPPAPAIRLGFTGHEHDDEGVGLINMGGRIYDARLGRFLTPDPHVSAPLSSQGHDRYAYVFNNPLRYTDPSGFKACEIKPNETCVSAEREPSRTLTPGPGTPLDQDTSRAGGPAGRARGGDARGGRSRVTAGDIKAMSPRERLEFFAEEGFSDGNTPNSFELEAGEWVQGKWGEARQDLDKVTELTELLYSGGKSHIEGLTPAPAQVPNAKATSAQTPSQPKPPINASMAGKKHPVTGVPFDKAGYPDFKAAGVVHKEVQITYTGSRRGDFAAANREAGYQSTPPGMTWHHHQDGRTMQLVPTDVHSRTGHTGGFSGGRR